MLKRPFDNLFVLRINTVRKKKKLRSSQFLKNTGKARKVLIVKVCCCIVLPRLSRRVLRWRQTCVHAFTTTARFGKEESVCYVCREGGIQPSTTSNRKVIMFFLASIHGVVGLATGMLEYWNEKTCWSSRICNYISKYGGKMKRKRL